MWDLATLQRENNKICIEAMQRREEEEEKREKKLRPISFSLQEVAAKMQVGPPLLEDLWDCFQNLHDIQAFVNMIRKFLPEHESKILQERRNGRVAVFCHYFGKKYWPLPQYAHENKLENFIVGLPIELMGMSYDAYHELDFRLGFSLMLSLVVYPYEGDERDEEELEFLQGKKPRYTPFMSAYWAQDIEPDVRKQDPEGTKGKTLMEIFTQGRMPVLDLASKTVGTDILRAMPSEGWSPEELHKMTDGTKYDGVGHFADWVCQRTGCILLDANYSDCEYQEGWAEPVFYWSEWNVHTLAKQYPKMQEIRHKIGSIADWIEVDPKNRFTELLRFLYDHRVARKHKRPEKAEKYEYDPTELWCPLEQIGMYEEEDYDDDEREERTETPAGPKLRIKQEGLGLGIAGIVRQFSPQEFIEGIDPDELDDFDDGLGDFPDDEDDEDE
jgi:hypothetical protein